MDIVSEGFLSAIVLPEIKDRDFMIRFGRREVKENAQ